MQYRCKLKAKEKPESAGEGNLSAGPNRKPAGARFSKARSVLEC